MNADDIAKARQAIADEATGPTFLSTRHGERYLDAVKDTRSGWSAALDEVERLQVENETHSKIADEAAATIKEFAAEIERLNAVINSGLAEVYG